MTDFCETLTFQTSRLKAFQNALFVISAVVVFGCLARIPFNTLLPEKSLQGWKTVVPLGVWVTIGIVAAIRMFRPVISPDTLALTGQGWRESRFGRIETFNWSDYNDATKQVIDRGKGGASTYVRLEPKAGGKAVLIRASQYAYPFDSVFSAVKSAQSGRLVSPQQAPFPYANAFLLTPTLVVCYVSLCWYGWHLTRHRPPTEGYRASRFHH